MFLGSHLYVTVVPSVVPLRGVGIRDYLYFRTQKSERTGGTSAIRTSSIALGLHRPSCSKV